MARCVTVQIPPAPVILLQVMNKGAISLFGLKVCTVVYEH